MHLSSITALVLLALSQSSFALDPTRLIYEFPNGTWLENLAVRPCGSILTTIITSPELYLTDPFDPKPTLVHRFPGLWLTGITETTPDTFYVIVANSTLKALNPTPGSNRIFKVAFSTPKSPAEISLVATVPKAVFLNGLTTLSPTTLLASDSTLGVVWAIDVIRGTSRIVIQDALMAPTPVLPLGINGIRLYRGRTLFFANSDQMLFAKIEINPDGTAVAAAKKIASSAPGTAYDDFALDWKGDAFLATGAGDSIAEVKRNGKQTIVAGVVNTTEIAEPTSAQFGRTPFDKHILYVTTGGGLAIPIDGYKIVGGQLLAVDTKGN